MLPLCSFGLPLLSGVSLHKQQQRRARAREWHGMGEADVCVVGLKFRAAATRRGISLYPSPNFILAGYTVPPARLRLSATMTGSAPMRQRRRQWSTCAELGGSVPALAFLACV